MRKKAEALYTLYLHGRISSERLQKAVRDGVITQEEYDLIVAA